MANLLDRIEDSNKSQDHQVMALIVIVDDRQRMMMRSSQLLLFAIFYGEAFDCTVQ
jgi:hypothetical protein